LTMVDLFGRIRFMEQRLYRLYLHEDSETSSWIYIRLVGDNGLFITQVDNTVIYIGEPRHFWHRKKVLG
jgi:hypothetical protein